MGLKAYSFLISFKLLIAAFACYVRVLPGSPCVLGARFEGFPVLQLAIVRLD